MTNDAFPMALRFAERDFLLSAEDLLYWTSSHATLREHTPAPTGRPKRRRPRRSRRGGGGSGGGPAGGGNGGDDRENGGESAEVHPL